MKAVSLSSAAERLRTQGDGWAELRGKVKESAGGRRAAGFSPTGHRGTASPLTLPPSLTPSPRAARGRRRAALRSARRGERGRAALQPPAPPQAAQRCAAPLRSGAAPGRREPRRGRGCRAGSRRARCSSCQPCSARRRRPSTWTRRS